MSGVPPFPKDEPVVDARGRLSTPWWRWLNGFLSQGNTADGAITTLTAYAARVVTLETTVVAEAALIAALDAEADALAAQIAALELLHANPFTVDDLHVTGQAVLDLELQVGGDAQIDLDLNVDGAVTLGSTLGVTGLLTLTGGQIAFPATAVPSSDANTLDDYEEGSWTPALTFGGAATGLTYGDRLGRYLKVGRLVTVTWRIVLTAKGASAGAALISGLPFTAENVSPTMNVAGATVAAAMAALTSPISSRVLGNTTTMDLFDWGAAGIVAVDDTNFTNTSAILGATTYLADA